MATKSFSSGDQGSKIGCSARVDYGGRQGSCQRVGSHPDADGIRWWCGIHNPDRPLKSKSSISKEVVPLLADRTVSDDGMVTLSFVDPESMRQAMRDAQQALIEISNIRVSSWGENVPVEKYRIMIDHMANLAKEASVALTEKILKLGT